ncbi:hypothetical protein Hanom_Chr04g00292891 [Helianthus anomalus]
MGYWILIIQSFTNWPVIIRTSKIAYNSPNLRSLEVGDDKWWSPLVVSGVKKVVGISCRSPELRRWLKF